MHAKPCPKCGHCPTCGRSNATPYGYWPPPWPRPYGPFYIGDVAPHSYTVGAQTATAQHPLSNLTTTSGAASSWASS